MQEQGNYQEHTSALTVIGIGGFTVTHYRYFAPALVHPRQVHRHLLRKVFPGYVKNY